MKIGLFLEDDDVYLRPYTNEDVPFFLTWCNDPCSRKLILQNWPQNAMLWKKIIESKSLGQSGIGFTIISKEINSPVGMIEINNIDQLSRRCEFEIMVGDNKAKSKGVGSKSTKLVLDYLFGDLNMNRIYFKTLVENEKAQIMLSKLGFEREGLMKEHIYIDGMYHDMYLYGLLRKKYLGEL